MATIEGKYISRTEARKALRLSRDQMIYRIRRGDVKAVKVGYNYAIPVTELTRVPTTDWYKGTLLQQESPTS